MHFLAEHTFDTTPGLVLRTARKAHWATRCSATPLNKPTFEHHVSRVHNTWTRESRKDICFCNPPTAGGLCLDVPTCQQCMTQWWGHLTQKKTCISEKINAKKLKKKNFQSQINAGAKSIAHLGAAKKSSRWTSKVFQSAHALHP